MWKKVDLTWGFLQLVSLVGGPTGPTTLNFDMQKLIQMGAVSKGNKGTRVTQEDDLNDGEKTLNPFFVVVVAVVFPVVTPWGEDIVNPNSLWQTVWISVDRRHPALVV